VRKALHANIDPEAMTRITHPELETLRADIDAIDAQIVTLLASRFRITSKVGQLKARHALDPVDPDREAVQEARFRALAQANGLKPELVVGIFRSVIDEVIVNHRDAP
jgi:chorismate mutase